MEIKTERLLIRKVIADDWDLSKSEQKGYRFIKMIQEMIYILKVAYLS